MPDSAFPAGSTYAHLTREELIKTLEQDILTYAVAYRHQPCVTDTELADGLKCPISAVQQALKHLADNPGTGELIYTIGIDSRSIKVTGATPV